MADHIMNSWIEGVNLLYEYIDGKLSWIEKDNDSWFEFYLDLTIKKRNIIMITILS